jgi:hypothetical protein
MKWLDNLIKQLADSDNQPFIDKITKLEKKINVLEDNIILRNSEIIKLNKKIAYLHDEIVKKSQEKEIKSLVNPVKNILDYKDKYINGHENTGPYKYPFNNDNKDRDIKYSLYLSPEGEKIINSAINIISAKYNTNSPVEVIKNVQKYFFIKKNWEYVSDKGDFWNRADISWETRKGDCDDLAILMHNICYYWLRQSYLGHEWRIELFIGDVLKEGGHALNKWLGDDGEWYAVESTFDLKGSYTRNFLKTPIRFNHLYYGFRGFATKDKSWKGSLSSLKNFMEE